MNNRDPNKGWWVTYKEALKVDPDFFKKRADKSWKWDPNERKLCSKWGVYEIRVMLKGDGSLDFDRAIYRETPGFCAVVYGIDKEKKYQIGVVAEMRPFSDTPDGKVAKPPIVFGQPAIMGVLDRIIGPKGTEIFETTEEGARREALEEAGLRHIISINSLGQQNPNPAICASWDILLEIEVDLAEMARMKNEKGQESEEKVTKVEFVSVGELLKRISNGGHNGVNYRSAVANGALLIWISRHPEALRTIDE